MTMISIVVAAVADVAYRIYIVVPLTPTFYILINTSLINEVRED